MCVNVWTQYLCYLIIKYCYTFVTTIYFIKLEKQNNNNNNNT